MNEGLFKHFIHQTNTQFQDIKSDLKEVNRKMDDFHTFKVKMLTHSFWVSVLTSGACGLATMLVTAYFTHKLEGK